MISIYSSSTPPLFYQHQSGNAVATGAVQWNGTYRRFEVSTGSGWVAIDNNVNITTSGEVEEIIKWAQKKMIEEKELEKLAQTNSALKDLITQKKKIESQIDIIKKMVI